MVLPLQGGIKIVGFVWPLPGPQKADPQEIAHHLLHGLAVLLIHSQQEKREHDQDHAHRRRVAAHRNPQQEEQRNADERPAAEAD